MTTEKTLRAEWAAISRDIVLTAVRQEALEGRASQLHEQCIGVPVGKLPLVSLISVRWAAARPLTDLVQAAIAEGVVTPADVKKAARIGVDDRRDTNSSPS